LLFGKTDATDKEVIEALKSANAYDFVVQKMGSKGVDTVVGASGG
jgi:ATP-binding cassette subfamily B (MDR/TAP) protein 1